MILLLLIYLLIPFIVVSHPRGTSNPSEAFINHLKQTIFTLILTALCVALLALSAESQPAPGYDGREDHAITLEEALQLTANFRANAGPEQIRGGYFGGQAILELLSQEGCVGLRYYYARTDEGQPCLVLVGVNAAGEDMREGKRVERSFPCPPICPGSPLNPK